MLFISTQIGVSEICSWYFYVLICIIVDTRSTGVVFWTVPVRRKGHANTMWQISVRKWNNIAFYDMFSMMSWMWNEKQMVKKNSFVSVFGCVYNIISSYLLFISNKMPLKSLAPYSKQTTKTSSIASSIVTGNFMPFEIAPGLLLSSAIFRGLH